MVTEEGDTLHSPALGVREIKERWPMPVLVGNKLLELTATLIVCPASSCQRIEKHQPKLFGIFRKVLFFDPYSVSVWKRWIRQNNGGIRYVEKGRQQIARNLRL